MWDYGFWGDNYEMCARLLDPSEILITWTPPHVPVYEVFIEDANPDWPWISLGIFNKPNNYPHFPYGNEVEPD